jgi:hypothetical protein
MTAQGNSYWVRGLDVRQGRGLSAAPVRAEEVTEN